MKKIAVTGVIASGKSQVCKIIEDLGGYVIYTDKINAELFQNADYIARLAKIFPTAINNGMVDKAKIRQIISVNNEKREQLNRLAHSEIKIKVQKMIDNYNGNVIFCEIPLLIEANMVDFFDEIWCVNSDFEIKLQRLVARDNISKIDAEKIINCQTNDKKLLQIANVIIENNGSLNELFEQVKTLLSKR